MKKERYFSAEYSTHTVYAEPYKCNWIPGQYFEPLSGKVFSHTLKSDSEVGVQLITVSFYVPIWTQSNNGHRQEIFTQIISCKR